jgi:hypothetical protein
MPEWFLPLAGSITSTDDETIVEVDAPSATN